MMTIGVLGWGTAAAVELVGRRITRWLPARQPGGAR
jgi:NitT/TauT family transport system permease protein